MGDNNFGLNEIGSDTDNAAGQGTNGTLAGYLRAIRDVMASVGITSGSGLKATAAAPTYSEGSSDNFSGDLAGNLRTVEKNSAAILAAVTEANAGFSYENLNGAGTTLVKSGAGVLHLANVNTKGTVASVIQIYDGLTAGGTLIAQIDSLNLSGPFQYDVAFATGLTVVVTGTVGPNATIAYR